MPKFDVFYKKAKRSLEYDQKPADMNDLVRNYQCLKVGVEAKDKEDLFHKMQGEVWSPNGEAREEIVKLGLSHTSMYVGDIALDEEGKLWFVEAIGWSRLFPDITV